MPPAGDQNNASRTKTDGADYPYHCCWGQGTNRHLDMIIQPLGNNGEVHPRGTIRLRKRRSAEKAFIMKAFMMNRRARAPSCMMMKTASFLFFSSAAIKQCFIIPRSVPFRPVWAWFWPPSSTPVLGGRPRGSFPAGRTREERAGRHKSRSCGLALALGKQIDRFVFSL